jgi:hypothetical protein
MFKEYLALNCIRQVLAAQNCICLRFFAHTSEPDQGSTSVEDEVLLTSSAWRASADSYCFGSN